MGSLVLLSFEYFGLFERRAMKCSSRSKRGLRGHGGLPQAKYRWLDQELPQLSDHFRMLRIEQTLSFPKSPQALNEDGLFISEDLCVVFDGATGLCPPMIPGIGSDAAWFVQGVIAELKRRWQPGGSFQETLREICTVLSVDYARLVGSSVKEVPIQYQPLAALAAVQKIPGKLLFHRFGDCSAIIGDDVAAIWVFPPSPLEALDAYNTAWMVEHRSEGLPLDAVRQLIFPRLATARALHANAIGGYWVLGLNPESSQYMETITLDCDAQPESILLMSDGYSALVDDYCKDWNAAQLLACSRKGLGAAYNLIRDIERMDPEAWVYPRFKTSDDCSAILLQA